LCHNLKDEKNSSSAGDREAFKWCGVEAVMQSYFTHAAGMTILWTVNLYHLKDIRRV